MVQSRSRQNIRKTPDYPRFAHRGGYNTFVARYLVEWLCPEMEILQWILSNILGSTELDSHMKTVHVAAGNVVGGIRGVHGIIMGSISYHYCRGFTWKVSHRHGPKDSHQESHEVKFLLLSCSNRQEGAESLQKQMKTLEES